MKKSTTTLWVLLSIIGLGLTFFAWALSSPVGASPDEDFHLASIWCGGGEQPGKCESAARDGFKKVPPALLSAQCFAFDSRISADCQQKNNTFDDSPLVETNRGSFSSNYPPLYYWVASSLVTNDVKASVIAIRTMNIFVFVVFICGLLVVAPKSMKPSIYWGWVIVLIPLGVFLVASVNPSSWAISCVPTAFMALLIFCKTAKWRAVLSGSIFVIATTFASGARGDAALYTLLGVGLVLMLQFRRDIDFLKKLWLPLIGVLISISFYSSSLQSSVAIAGLTHSDELGGAVRSPLAVFSANIIQVPELWVGAFGYWPLGWLDTPMPAIVWVLSAGIFAGITFTLVRSIRSSHKAGVFMLAAVLYLLPIYVLQRGMNLVGEQVQPRYLLPLIALFSMLVTLSIGEYGIRLSKVQIRISQAGLIVANSVALLVNLKRYSVGSNGGIGELLSTVNGSWWWNLPLSPIFVWAAGTLSFTVGIIAAHHLVTHEAKTIEEHVIVPRGWAETP